MKKLVVQLFVGLIGLFILVWGEVKQYVASHPEITNTFHLEAKRAEPLQYYNYQVAYDPNSGKTWYYYGDGFWYDRPPTIRKRSAQEQTKKEPSIGGNVQGQVNRQTTQATAYPTRY